MLVRLAILALRPVELYHEWNVKRSYRKGKFRRPADIGAGAVTTMNPTQPLDLAGQVSLLTGLSRKELDELGGVSDRD